MASARREAIADRMGPLGSDSGSTVHRGPSPRAGSKRNGVTDMRAPHVRWATPIGGWEKGRRIGLRREREGGWGVSGPEGKEEGVGLRVRGRGWPARGRKEEEWAGAVGPAGEERRGEERRGEERRGDGLLPQPAGKEKKRERKKRKREKEEREKERKKGKRKGKEKRTF
uniref:Uncharacterized protein n=1 Tax=Oryza brachyantha TaxID=4533 RepID=J3N7Z9_ORYBR